ncbi:MAG: response regulator transcription factor [Acidobacteria bacterium]|nr:response regulator transcription factor [Acidobacteriota bacterium]
MTLRVAFVEDDANYRSGLEALFSYEPGIALAGSFDSPTAFLREAAPETGRPRLSGLNLVLMDLDLPEMSGIEVIRRFKAGVADVPVVALTVFEEPATILQAICAGADGYLLKKTPASDLIAQIRVVASGGSPLTPGVARSILQILRSPGEGVRSPAARPVAAALDLSEREQQVLRCLVRGLAYKQAADEMNISLDTVRTYIRRIYGKLQVHSVAEAVGRALREGLV